MKTIKKVSVTPLPATTGNIIDSFNTSDDKHTNAPSINAVEGKITEVNSNIAVESFTDNNVSIEGEAEKIVVFDITKANYTPIGIIQIANTESLVQANVYIQGFSIQITTNNEKQAWIKLKNPLSSSISIRCFIKVLYLKDTLVS